MNTQVMGRLRLLPDFIIYPLPFILFFLLWVTPARASDNSPGSFSYLPLLLRQPPAGGCPATSSHTYRPGYAYQAEFDNPVRPAANHADKNLALRGYIPNSDPALPRELVNYGTDDPTQPPQLATLFVPYRVPPLSGFYRVHGWNWQSSPLPGTQGNPITTWPVTALGLQTEPGQPVVVPTSAYDIGSGMQVLVLFADEESLTLRYAREDSAGARGYTLHLDGLCTDPNLLALFRDLDRADGARYVYVPPAQRPYTYNLPALAAGEPLGTAAGTEIVVAVVDTGNFMDPRSCNEWWQIRPGYAGACPAHR